MNYRGSCAPLLWITLAHTIFLSTITAAQAQNFTVSPMITLAESKGGQAKSSVIVTNNAREPLRLRVFAEDFTYDRTKGFAIIKSHNRSAVPYLQFSPRELVVPPGVTRNIRVSTILPPSTPNGEYRVVLFLEDLKEKQIQNTGNSNPVVMKAKVASVFYISKGSIRADVQANSAIWDNKAKKLALVLSNKGQRSAYPNVDWKIEKDGKEIAKSVIAGVVLQSESDREVTLQNVNNSLSLSSGVYNLSGEISNVDKQKIPFSLKVTIP
jgi:hypothetical protein